MVQKFVWFIGILFVQNVAAFPQNFDWGTATAAFQVEGGWNVSGRGPSIWDYFTTFPGRIYDNQTAQVADDFYHRYPEDIKIIKELGVKNFRVSISWTRIFPTGDSTSPNQEGVKFYSDLFDSLLSAGIEPWVTLYHWDLPQTFNNFTSQSGWLDPDTAYRFNEYADFCFSTFGNRIKNWITMNEIQTFTWIGYGVGVHAPGRCSPQIGDWCQKIGGGGNSSTEPYIAAHNALIAHGLAVKTYREKYQRVQRGKIGMTISSGFAVPFNTSEPKDIEAVNIAVAFQYGWFADPQVFGKYPKEMTDLITGSRLPNFTDYTSELLKGSYDFLGLNYYSSSYAKWTGVPGSVYGNDTRIESSPYNASGHLIGPFAESTWLNVYPEGLRGILNWIKDRYNSPIIYIFENGVSCPGESQLPEAIALNDTFRMNYIQDHITQMIYAYDYDFVEVRGYFLWSLLDNFEWSDGYNVRFGVTYVNYDQNLTRTVKNSGYLYRDIIKKLSYNNKLETSRL
jgi:beta-glucosidase